MFHDAYTVSAAPNSALARALSAHFGRHADVNVMDGHLNAIPASMLADLVVVSAHTEVSLTATKHIEADVKRWTTLLATLRSR